MNMVLENKKIKQLAAYKHVYKQVISCLFNLYKKMKSKKFLLGFWFSRMSLHPAEK